MFVFDCVIGFCICLNLQIWWQKFAGRQFSGVPVTPFVGFFSSSFKAGSLLTIPSVAVRTSVDGREFHTGSTAQVDAALTKVSLEIEAVHQLAQGTRAGGKITR